MKKIVVGLLAIAGLVLSNAVGATEAGGYTNAATLTGPERYLADQGGNTVNVTSDQIKVYATPGGSCTNQVVNAISNGAVPVCHTVTGTDTDTTIAKTGADINTSNQVTATHLALPLPVNQGGTNTASALVGFIRGDPSTMTATELSGAISTSGSGVTTLGQGVVTDANGSLVNKPPVGVVTITTPTLSGVQTIDGILGVAAQTLVLVANPTPAASNGPWIMQSAAWTRPNWYPSGGTTQAAQFDVVRVRLGAVYSGSLWDITTSGAITIDTTAVTWAIKLPQINNNTVANGVTGSGDVVEQNSPSLITPNLGAATASSLTDSAITGSTQCVHANSSGLLSGTGADCGAGGGGSLPTSAALLASNSSAAATAVSVGAGLAINSAVLNANALINAQTGTSYTILTTDSGKLDTFSNASAIAVTLPSATTSGFGAGFSFDVQDVGASTVTITPTTSTINGAATLVLTANKGCSITSDGTNYQVSACTAVDASSLNLSVGGGTSATPNCSYSLNYSTATAASGTFTINAPTGCTPTEGKKLTLHFKFTNSQTYSWNAAFTGGTVALPTTSTGSSKGDWLAFLYDSVNAIWDFVAIATGF
jgi:hypothetical protein